MHTAANATTVTHVSAIAITAESDVGSCASGRAPVLPLARAALAAASSTATSAVSGIIAPTRLRGAR